MPTLLRLSALLISWAVLATACGKKSSSSTDPKWPSRPTKVWSEKVRGVSFQITLPEGLGVFRDRNVVIWRVDNLGRGPLLKVARARPPRTLQDAKQTALLGLHDRFTRAQKTADGYWLVMKDTQRGTTKVTRYLTKNGRTLKCWAFFFWRGKRPHHIEAHNALLERICQSVRITGVRGD